MTAPWSRVRGRSRTGRRRTPPGRRSDVAEGLTVAAAEGGPPPLTVAELEQWTDSGARWRALEVGNDRAVVEMCTCYGEPVDLRAGASPELIEFLRSRRASE